MRGRELSVHRKCVVLFPQYLPSLQRTVSGNFPRKTCYLCIKCRALAGPFFHVFVQTPFEPLLTSGIKCGLWQWVSHSVCYLECSFCSANLLFHFMLPCSCMVWGSGQAFSHAADWRGTNCRSVKFLPNSSTTIPSQKKKETLKPHLCLQR